MPANQSNDPISTVATIGSGLPTQQEQLGKLSAASADAAAGVTQSKGALDKKTADFSGALTKQAGERFLNESNAVKFETPPQFRTPQETLSGFASLFTLLGTLAFAGGARSRTNGMGAMAAMTGALKGWHQGEVENYNRAMNDYNANLKRITMDNQVKQQQLQQIERAWTVDKAEIPALVAQYTADNQGDYTSALVNQGRIDAALKYQTQITKTASDMAGRSAQMENAGRIAAMHIAAQKQIAAAHMAQAQSLENQREKAAMDRAQLAANPLAALGMMNNSGGSGASASGAQVPGATNQSTASSNVPHVANPQASTKAQIIASLPKDKSGERVVPPGEAAALMSNLDVASHIPGVPLGGAFVPQVIRYIMTGQRPGYMGNRNAQLAYEMTLEPILKALGMPAGAPAQIAQSYKATGEAVGKSLTNLVNIQSSMSSLENTVPKAVELASKLGLNGLPSANAVKLFGYSQALDVKSPLYKTYREYMTLAREMAADYVGVFARGSHNVDAQKVARATIMANSGTALTGDLDAMKFGSEKILNKTRDTLAQQQANTLAIVHTYSTNHNLADALFGTVTPSPSATFGANENPASAAGVVTQPSATEPAVSDGGFKILSVH